MIADSSVLIAFARARRLGLLRDTFGRIEIPPEVRAEVIEARPEREDARRLQEALKEGWIVVRDADLRSVRRLHRQYPNLGRGELGCIALARPRGGTLLLDEATGRRAARLEGLSVVGSLGILAHAYARGPLKERADLAAALRDLLAEGLWVGSDVIEAFWASVGGRP